MGLRFEWNAEKASANDAKHQVSFHEAATVFGDTLSMWIQDPDHSIGEERGLLIGLTYRGSLVVVAHTERPDGSIRIISARLATKAERREYEGR